MAMKGKMVHDEGKKALTHHVLKNVFQLENGSPLVLTLKHCHYSDILDVHCMAFEDIDLLQYKDTNSNNVPLQEGLHAHTRFESSSTSTCFTF
jgi:predicted nucleic-acid-binding Zn-ribbon protein